MAGKRKRNRPGCGGRAESKRQKISGGFNPKNPVIKSAVLAKYYPQVLTLREYLLSKLPASSKIRRRKILSVGTRRVPGGEGDALATHLDETLVGILTHRDISQEVRLQQWNTFSQRIDTSDSNVGNTSGLGGFSQVEIVDFAIWLLFCGSRNTTNSKRTPKPANTFGRIQHLLCQGFRKEHISRNQDQNAPSAIPGIISTYPNSHVTSMKTSPWPQVLTLMGREGERAMIDLILDCGIFLPIKNGLGSFHQLSGEPLNTLQLIQENPVRTSLLKASSTIESISETGLSQWKRSIPKSAPGIGRAQGELQPISEKLVYSAFQVLLTTKPAPVAGLRPSEHNALPEKPILPRPRKASPATKDTSGAALGTTLHTPSNIQFVRNRMLYARAALNAQGAIRFGFRHIHVLNQSPYPSQQDNSKLQPTKPHESTIRVMMYLFPRQFGLHNVFTSKVNRQETVQPFKDYTSRKDEINKKYPCVLDAKIPRRLRGNAARLVRKLQIQHSRCPYKSLLQYYCPSPYERQTLQLPSKTEPSIVSTAFMTQMPVGTGSIVASEVPHPEIPGRQSTMMDHATPVAMVSAFCRAVLAIIIPHNCLGTGELQTKNKHVFFRNVDRFIGLKRFETLTLHEMTQGIKITDIEWLGPPGSPRQKLSQSDFNKRSEIFHEFLYYMFDSLLIPLICTNFHVTESNVHGSRLFFFRHDVWKTIAEPAITSLKMTTFEEVKMARAQKILHSRALGFSQMRLLPKETGVRPIMNLKRRPLKKGSKTELGSSINSVLKRVYNMLTYETVSNPNRLGSTVFSVGDLYNKLKVFKLGLSTASKPPLYFAKVDVKAAFDTIPQDAVLKLMACIPSQSEYRISKHVEIKSGERDQSGDYRSKPICKWEALARAPDDIQTFQENLKSDLAIGKKNTIFIENIANQFEDKEDLISLLKEHVTQNMVKIDKKFYRQKQGIPQGSVVSSLLCNYFYADLEASHLQFLSGGNSLLVRLIDDFLLITTDRVHAKRFLQVMHDGLPEYGVQVNSDKTLTNFEVTINGKQVHRLVGTREFPYCGSFIDTKTLDLSKDRERKKDMAIANLLTVEYSKVPGKTFHRKVLNMFKIEAHAMFLDTTHNSLRTVLSNIHVAFVQTATKMWTYTRCLPVGKQPRAQLIITTIQDVVELAFVLLKSKGKNGNKALKGYRCAVTKVQVEWLALNAFEEVLRRRQSKYGKVLEWIKGRIERLRVRESTMCQGMKGVVRQ